MTYLITSSNIWPKVSLVLDFFITLTIFASTTILCTSFFTYYFFTFSSIGWYYSRRLYVKIWFDFKHFINWDKVMITYFLLSLYETTTLIPWKTNSVFFPFSLFYFSTLSNIMVSFSIKGANKGYELLLMEEKSVFGQASGAWTLFIIINVTPDCFCMFVNDLIISDIVSPIECIFLYLSLLDVMFCRIWVSELILKSIP